MIRLVDHIMIYQLPSKSERVVHLHLEVVVRGLAVLGKKLLTHSAVHVLIAHMKMYIHLPVHVLCVQ